MLVTRGKCYSVFVIQARENITNHGEVKGTPKNEETADAESDVADDLGADEIEAMEILMTIEEELDFEIPEAEIKTVDEFGELILSLEYKQRKIKYNCSTVIFQRKHKKY